LEPLQRRDLVAAVRAWVWFDETQAVTPLPGEQRPGEPHVATGEEETYPFGL